MRITLEGENTLTVSEFERPRMEVDLAPGVHAHFSSFEMFVTGIGLCTSAVLSAYGDQLGLDTAELAVRLTWKMEEEPRRIGELVTDFYWPQLPDSRRAAAEYAAQTYCPLHRTLQQPPKLTTRVFTGAMPAPQREAPGAVTSPD